jgi:ATP-dependent DNA helicase RecQ
LSTIHAILKEYWGYASFRPLQEDIINTILSGKDCLALLPTGGGKSLCFQVPAMATEGLCLVVSPLIALMKDQVENLRKKNITAFAIYSGMSRKEVINTLSIAGNSNCKFLYVSPERLETNLFKEYLPSFNVNLIAIDEAHCISQWGYDFRPSYLKIAALREELPNVPVLALTASATQEVQDDICEKLLFNNKKNVFRQPFSRPNLSYSVFNVSSKINKIIDILQKVKGTGIVYCKSRKRTREISDLLNMHGIIADYYHAGLSQEQRNTKQEAWLKDETRIIVCTNAFGMGIDKPSVRIVVHADTPDCLENYYQEAGRAGRDGNKSYAVLLYNEEEINELQELVNTRYPSLGLIRKTYADLMNHLQIASGTGEGIYFELDINYFIKQFNIDGYTVYAVLKTLEQENILYFNDQVFNPSKIQVIANRERLTEIENNQLALDAVLKSLLRNYEGIIDQPVNIYENTVAANTRIHPDELTDRLKTMHAYGLIDYQPQKNKPQVYLVQNRIKADDLTINMESYNKRKARFEARLAKMIEYVYSTEECRSVIIGKYFGDADIKDCGICDACLDKKKTNLSQTEFENINDSIIKIIKDKPATTNELVSRFKQVPKYKIMEVIRFLQAEEKIIISDNGTIASSF